MLQNKEINEAIDIQFEREDNVVILCTLNIKQRPKKSEMKESNI